MKTSLLYLPTRNEADEMKHQALLDAAKPCPFCGSAELSGGLWDLEEGEVYAIECDICFAGAPAAAWQKRKI